MAYTPQAWLNESGEKSSDDHDTRLEASGTVKPTSIAVLGFGLAILVLEPLLSDTGKSLRLYIIEVGERSTFRRCCKRRGRRVDAAEIEAPHGMHLCQRPPAVPRRCMTFGPCQRPARRGRAHGGAHGGATARPAAEPTAGPAAEPTAGPTAEPMAEPTPDAAAAGTERGPQRRGTRIAGNR